MDKLTAKLSEREAWVDYAKGIGIILVVYGHTVRGIINAGIKQDDALYRLVDSIIYSFHMPLFFFLSGLFFISSLTKRGPYSQFKSKLATIFYPYMIWSLLQGLIEVILSNYTNGDVTLSQVFSLLWAPRAQFWFLYALFLVSSVGILIYVKLSPKYYWLVVIIAAIAYVYRFELQVIPLTGFVLHNFVFFALGIAVYEKMGVLIKYNPIILPGTLIAFIAYQWYFHIQLGFFYKTDFLGLALLLAIASIMFMVSLSLFLSKFHINWLAFVGTASLGIYVMHTLAGSGIRIILQKFLGINEIWTHVTVGTLTGVLLPLAIMVFFRKNIKILFTPPKILR